MLVPSLAIPLALLLWPSMAAAQTLTPPPVNATGPTTSASVTRTSTPSASASGSGNGTSVNATSTTPSATSSADFPSLSGYSACVSNCLGLSVSEVGCNSLVDVQCFCTNGTRFAHSLTSCITSQCPTDLTNAETVSQQFCALASPNVSLSFPPPSSTPSSTPSSSSSTSTSQSTTATSNQTTTPPGPTPTGPATGGAMNLGVSVPGLGGVVLVSIGSAVAAIALGW